MLFIGHERRKTENKTTLYEANKIKTIALLSWDKQVQNNYDMTESRSNMAGNTEYEIMKKIESHVENMK